MAKGIAYFIDWGKDETEVKKIELKGEGFVQGAYFLSPPQSKFLGTWEQRIDAIAMMIAKYKPDIVISDDTGIGASCTKILKDRLKIIGIEK